MKAFSFQRRGHWAPRWIVTHDALSRWLSLVLQVAVRELDSDSHRHASAFCSRSPSPSCWFCSSPSYASFFCMIEPHPSGPRLCSSTPRASFLFMCSYASRAVRNGLAAAEEEYCPALPTPSPLLGPPLQSPRCFFLPDSLVYGPLRLRTRGGGAFPSRQLSGRPFGPVACRGGFRIVQFRVYALLP